jgi:hypothetical protein
MRRPPEMALVLEGPEDDVTVAPGVTLVLYRPAHCEHRPGPHHLDRQLPGRPADGGEDRRLYADAGRSRPLDRGFQRKTAAPLTHHLPDGLHRRLVVAAVPSGKPPGSGETEPGLPGPKRGDGYAGSLGDLPDGQAGGCSFRSDTRSP